MHDRVQVNRSVSRRIKIGACDPKHESTAASRRFGHCDLFSSVPTKGDGLPVSIDGERLADGEMPTFARRTNLAETAPLLTPTTDAADCRMGVLPQARAMPFAGHPTPGGCGSRLLRAETPAVCNLVLQECAGIATIDIDGQMPSFEAPGANVEPLPRDASHAMKATLGLSSDRILRRSSRERADPAGP